MPQARTRKGEIARLKYLMTEKYHSTNRLWIRYKQALRILQLFDEQRGFILESSPDPQVYEIFQELKKFLKKRMPDDSPEN